LIDIVVANEYLQMFSNRVIGAYWRAVITNLIAAARPSHDRSSEVSVAFEKAAPGGAR